MHTPAPGRGRSAALDAIDQIAAARPDIVLMGPLLAYILLLGLVGLVPVTWQPAAIVARGVGSLAVVWLFRRHLPPLGRPHWIIAIALGAFAAWGWSAGQQLFDHLGLGGRLPLMPGQRAVVDPRGELGSAELFWATWSLRMLVAVVAVPVVEELFWRGFLLRALIDWHHFDRLPLGHFAWVSFVGTALISTFQHPDNWVVSIFCWLLFNAVFVWTRSLLCLMLLHGFTNLVLYLIEWRVRDWGSW
jgi:membrane protease YdiL (CAAX protease family)